MDPGRVVSCLSARHDLAVLVHHWLADFVLEVSSLDPVHHLIVQQPPQAEDRQSQDWAEGREECSQPDLCEISGEDWEDPPGWHQAWDQHQAVASLPESSDNRNILFIQAEIAWWFYTMIQGGKLLIWSHQILSKQFRIRCLGPHLLCSTEHLGWYGSSARVISQEDWGRQHREGGEREQDYGDCEEVGGGGGEVKGTPRNQF